MSSLPHVHKCGLNELILFILAIIFGTGCSICSKIMMSMQGTTGIFGDDSELEYEYFQKPLFQTFGMFIGMLFGLVLHWIVSAFRLPFPGYHIGRHADDFSVEISSLLMEPFAKTGDDGKEFIDSSTTKKIPLSLYFTLAIPATLDLVATALGMVALQYLDVSMNLMLRGSGIIFVGLMKHYILKDRLQTFHWIGVFWIVVSVIIFGATAVLSSGSEDDVDSTKDVTPKETVLGVGLMLAGAFFQALQFVLEEHLMKTDDSAPPLLLIGMEGFWGTVASVFVMYPIGHLLPGGDHGSYENPFHTWAMLKNSRNIQVAFAIYLFTIFVYNVLAVLVTFMLSSIWHAILDNMRTITVWMTDLFIFYCISPLFGEVWTKFSYLQVLGFGVLLYGTAVYNGPNKGSILLIGRWYAFGIDCSHEYLCLEHEVL